MNTFVLSSRKILIVDDEEINRTFLHRQVRRLGHLPFLAIHGRQAIEQMESVSPDLILLDIDMPEMNGMKVLERLKADGTYSHVPVVMISGYDEMDRVAQCIKLGAEDYLVKPLNLTLLKARIYAGLEKKRLHDRQIGIITAMKDFNLRLQDRVTDQEQELSQAYLDTLNRLVVAAEHKDEDTGDHLMRISRYSAVLAEHVGLPGPAVQNILYAAPLHDVGKIGVPDSVLLKPGKLTDEEFDVMKRHTVIGAQILSNSKAAIIQMAQDIAVTHHEKWNGQGYPNGLRGEQIPLAGRIVALVDNFDALTSRRPYKEPYPATVACEIIKKGRGEHFDPALVDIFLAQIDAILRIKEKIGGVEPEHAGGFEWSERDALLAKEFK